MRLRFARHTHQLEELVAFYRDQVGFPEIGRFNGHAGYDGVFLDVPGSGAHLELTTGGGQPPSPAHPETLLVLYLASEDERAAIAHRIEGDPVTPENPFWQQHAIAFADPDGHQLLLAVDGSSR